MTLVEADTNTAFVSSPTLGPISSGITPKLSRSSTTLLPPLGSPPMNDLPLSPRTPERTSFDRLQLGRSSPTNSDATTSYPATPCDSLKGSFTLSPIDSLDMTRRSSSPSCPDSQLSPKTSSNNLRSFNRSFRINDSVNSLTPFRLGQQLSPATLHAAGRNPALPHQPSSPAWDTYRLGADIASSSLSSRSAPRSGSLPLPPTIHIPATMRHHSYATQSSSESIRELPITPTSNTIIHLASPSSAFSVTMDTMSISSGSTGTSSKQVLRMEKKA